MTQQELRPTSGAQPLQLPARESQDIRPGEAVAAIEARHFNFYYSAFKALNDISITAPRHEITALIGPSGCGKSTLLRAINRMHDRTPGARTEGELLLDGHDINAVADLVELGFGQIVLFTHDRGSDETLDLLASDVIARL